MTLSLAEIKAAAEEEDAERAYLLSRLMFGWILDAQHGNERPVFTLSSEEYRRRMEALAEREYDSAP